MNNTDQFIWIGAQSQLKLHQLERTLAHLAAAAGKKLSFSPPLLPDGVRAPRRLLAKEKENAGGLIVRLLGDEQTLEKGENGKSVGDSTTNVNAYDDSSVRLLAPAFPGYCLEQAKAEHYTQTSQIEKIWKKMHDTMYETFMEPAMHIPIQAVLSFIAISR